MERATFFTEKEKKELFTLYKRLIHSAGDSIDKSEIRKLKEYLTQAIQSNNLKRNSFDMNPIIRDMETAVIICDEM